MEEENEPEKKKRNGEEEKVRSGKTMEVERCEENEPEAKEEKGERKGKRRKEY